MLFEPTGARDMEYPMIRPVSLLDLEGLAALHDECFPEGHWTSDTFAQLLVSPHCFGLVSLGSYGSFEAPCGFVVARVVSDESEILTLGVGSGHRRLGFGRALVESVQKKSAAMGAKAMFLEVAEDNYQALSMYTHSRFEVVGRRRGYYQRRNGPKDGLLMRCDLNYHAVE